MSNSNGASVPSNDGKPPISGSNHVFVWRPVARVILLLFLGVAVLSLVLYKTSDPFGFLPNSYNYPSASPSKDTDIMWLRDPFPRFYSDADFQIACDQYYGNSSDAIANNANGGFNYVRSNNRTIQFYKFWYQARLTYPGEHDQDVFNKIKGRPFISRIGMKMRFLDTAYFGGFCQPSKNLSLVCTMHANCCIGLENKLYDLRILLQDWRRFMSLPPSMKASPPSSWSVPQKCRNTFEKLRMEKPHNGTKR